MSLPVATVLLADDHPGVRAAVRADLEEFGFRVCADVPDADSAVRAALRERPDICLLDVGMPGDGIEAARAIHEQLPGTRVVMLTVSRDQEHIRRALEAGAAGYLLKDLPAEALAAALASVLAGDPLPPARL
jgi:DNA-binding NarL/FixJ family response regulator